MKKQEIKEAASNIIEDVEGKDIDQEAKECILSFFKKIKTGNLKLITEEELLELENKVEEALVDHDGIYFEIQTFLDEAGFYENVKTK